MPLGTFSPKVEEEYVRWLQRVEPEGIQGNEYISVDEVLAAHFEIIDFFYKNPVLAKEKNAIGGVGPRDWNLLESACYRQYTSMGNIQKWNNVYEYAATLFFGLVKDHPFHDANKRTALLILLYHLYKNNICLTLSEEEIEDFAVDVANNDFGKYERYSSLEGVYPDKEIKFIAHHIKRHKEDIDKQEYFITFRELRRILNGFGFSLENPKKNSIELVRLPGNAAEIILGQSSFLYPRRIASIPFPGMSRQIGKTLLKNVRQLCGLTEDYGYTSRVFYGYDEPIQGLITVYQGPLRNLASR